MKFKYSPSQNNTKISAMHIARRLYDEQRKRAADKFSHWEFYAGGVKQV